MWWYDVRLYVLHSRTQVVPRPTVLRQPPTFGGYPSFILECIEDDHESVRVALGFIDP